MKALWLYAFLISFAGLVDPASGCMPHKGKLGFFLKSDHRQELIGDLPEPLQGMIHWRAMVTYAGSLRGRAQRLATNGLNVLLFRALTLDFKPRRFLKLDLFQKYNLEEMEGIDQSIEAFYANAPQGEMWRARVQAVFDDYVQTFYWEWRELPPFQC